MEFERPRGTRDFLFEEMRQRKQAEDILRNVFENYGFGEVQTPLFEDLKLFTTKSGEEIVDQLYNFKDKGDRDLALRPEITAPIARLYLNELQKTSKPIKIYYYGSGDNDKIVTSKVRQIVDYVDKAIPYEDSAKGQSLRTL